jgi:transcriptional regulator with XRE-family HTH domain
MVVDDVQTKEDDYERKPLGGKTAATTLFASLASTLASAPAQQPSRQCGLHGSTTWLTRKLCGRWLAARRLHAGITDARVADRTGVDAQSLQLLELGLAHDLAHDSEHWERLAVLLADADHDADLVLAVVQGALGADGWFTERTLEQIVGDLHAIAKEACPDLA